MAQTDEQYYENEDNFGKYQYVALPEIVNNIMLKAQIDDSIIKHIKRSIVLSFAKDCIRDLSEVGSKEILGFEITVPDSLVFPLPKDYVSYQGISLIVRNTTNGGFDLVDLDIAYNTHTHIGYLQDHDAGLLYDHNGYVLESDSSNAIAHPKKAPSSSSSYLGNSPTKDTSKYSKNGLFEINERRGIIVFSSELADKEVVIKYKSDGLQAELSDSEVSVHKDLKIPIQDYIVWQYLSLRNNVAESRIQSARRKYRTSRHKAVVDRADFDMLRISKIMNNATKIF